ncbi:MAG TPA: sugar phosphate isomerase/epimerase [Propioniciclava sp.]|uniref:sugar phosphate isomerase/epimerase family protein n=1 Tax=Propioniciclava sp. TaxID=2038686 RepID=UPI002B648CF3|nr:sugar phosphate isomerase/epimerase [Propioniciclava sp.]HRL48609.1 sugar phosphate isomerase/epimerase [Propioniciclava sp.]HRL80400.1 sugar phosphate isomerase/epimerase [Propioniciclava sp.]
MAVLGVQMMMLKDKVSTLGMYPVLQRIADLGITAVEVSQIPMDEENTAALRRGIDRLGLDVGALSVMLEPGSATPGDNLRDHFDKIVADCHRLETRFVRIGMVPMAAMASKEACIAWARECEDAARRLAAEGITLCYHNHHIDLSRFDGERIFDLVRRVAPSLQFEVDLFWVQRGGMAPLDMLKEYAGVCQLIHVKDYRVASVPQKALEMLARGDAAGSYAAFLDTIQFAEVGSGNMNWPELLPAANAAGAEYFFIEQDDTYGRDPFDCIADSRAYLASLGY